MCRQDSSCFGMSGGPGSGSDLGAWIAPIDNKVADGGVEDADAMSEWWQYQVAGADAWFTADYRLPAPGSGRHPRRPW